jgi:hypothetical protein
MDGGGDTEKGDVPFEVTNPGKADGSGLLSAADEARLVAAFDAVVAKGQTTIAQLETEIARLEADNARKQQEANTLVSNIAARERELQNNYNNNLLLCAFFPNPVTCVLANYLANDSTLSSYKRQLADAQAAQARIATEMQQYATKRDDLRARIDEIRAGKTRLLATLRDNQSPTYPSSLSTSPETGRAYWRATQMGKVETSIAQEIALLVDLRNAAVELSNVLDQSLNTLRALEQSVDALVEQSREQFMDLLSALLTGDPAAHAEKWLEDTIAKKTRDMLNALEWPLNEFARFVVERDGDPESLIQRILDKLANDLSPPPVSYEANTHVNLLDNTEARTGIDVTASRTNATVEVYVDLVHTYVGDLDMWVDHNGTTWNLQRNLSNSNDALKKTWVLDAGNIDVRGRWTLHIKDTADKDQGTLNRWTLVVR